MKCSGPDPRVVHGWPALGGTIFPGLKTLSALPVVHGGTGLSVGMALPVGTIDRTEHIFRNAGTVPVFQPRTARPIRLSRVEQQAATRESLLKGAETIFARLGYGGASIELIAAEAGYSKGAVSPNFASKEAPSFRAAARLHGPRHGRVREIVSGSPAQLFDSRYPTGSRRCTRTPTAPTGGGTSASRTASPVRREVLCAARSPTRTLALILETYFKAH